MDREQHTRDALGERLALVVGAEAAFALLVETVAFGAMLALGLNWQVRRSPV